MFYAIARAGPAAALRETGRNPREMSAYRTSGVTLEAEVVDRFGNAVPAAVVTWTGSGPVALDQATSETGPNGLARVTVRPRGSEGDASLRASVGALELLMPLTLGPATVMLDTYTYEFASDANLSRPAVDTIRVGGRVRWRLSVFDYDLHAVESVGEPSFVGGIFPYARDPIVLATFTTPGTYRYVDSGTGATGTVVVR
jgi:plastocyanin